ncbi:MAG: hypothetical protein JW734_09215 [Candidatus Omnitrophica bacterium]|nr:hypothetical protein [Candidatus Omnitrophota bacterium]
MKRFFNWQIMLGIFLVVLSAVAYFIHFLIFRDAHHIFIYLIGDIAFVFLEVLLVTLIMHQLLVHREKQALLKKLNMVIGAFFSEVGTELLKRLSHFDLEAGKVADRLVVTNDWPENEFIKVHKYLKSHESAIDSKKADLDDLKKFLAERREFLLILLENPNLLEHESFTNLLFAVFHLTEELVRRRSFKNLPDNDYKHISGDIKRAYGLLLSEWLDYMKYLKADYPYLFSLALRTNPFDRNACVEVR